MTVTDESGQRLSVKRGYKWQWDKLVPLVYANDKAMVYAKHTCFKKTAIQSSSSSNYIFIDSPDPLLFSFNVESVTSKNNLIKDVQELKGRYPNVILNMYKNTLAGYISRLQNSRIKWIRQNLYNVLNNLLFKLKPHYFYWFKSTKGLVTSPLLQKHPFVIEYESVNTSRTYIDSCLNAYYNGPYPVAEALICLNRFENGVVWNVLQLDMSRFAEYTISKVKHLINYYQENATDEQIQIIIQKLKKAIREEIGIKRIVCLDSVKQDNAGVNYSVTESTHKSYICLVECTDEQKAQIIYSPFSDSDATEKNIIIETSSINKCIWTSLLPFKSKKDRPMGDISYCESLEIIAGGISTRKKLNLKKKSFNFNNINIISKRTK